MPKKTVEVFLDSLTLEEVEPSQVKQVALAVEGMSYRLVLSPKSYEKLQAALAPFLAHEEPVGGPSAPVEASRAALGVDRAGRTAAPVLTSEERRALSEWALQEKGRKVAPRGRVALDLYRSWLAEGKPGLE